ncbi:hypothetical protein E2C01_012114 [Portunus trituberculatus]|uniref:Uncharacterized protein n=1 Tax=Portunus trituberculatus TaxID=210409 RepID=A0A5B7DD41_PORTR|nr:hypothetical protein [Portunus trituberculatus]
MFYETCWNSSSNAAPHHHSLTNIKRSSSYHRSLKARGKVDAAPSSRIPPRQAGGTARPPVTGQPVKVSGENSTKATIDSQETPMWTGSKKSERGSS